MILPAFYFSRPPSGSCSRLYPDCHRPTGVRPRCSKRSDRTAQMNSTLFPLCLHTLRRRLFLFILLHRSAGRQQERGLLPAGAAVAQ